MSWSAWGDGVSVCVRICVCVRVSTCTCVYVHVHTHVTWPVPATGAGAVASGAGMSRCQQQRVLGSSDSYQMHRMFKLHCCRVCVAHMHTCILTSGPLSCSSRERNRMMLLLFVLVWALCVSVWPDTCVCIPVVYTCASALLLVGPGFMKLWHLCPCWATRLSNL